MPETNSTTDLDREGEKTFSPISVLEKKELTTSETQESNNDERENVPHGTSKLTPEQEAIVRYNNKKTDRENVYIILGKILWWLIPIFVSFIIALIGLYFNAYIDQIKQINGPLSGLIERVNGVDKTIDSMQTVDMKDIKDINDKIKSLDDRLYNLKNSK